jgi:hypothetical protein
MVVVVGDDVEVEVAVVVDVVDADDVLVVGAMSTVTEGEVTVGIVIWVIQ